MTYHPTLPETLRVPASRRSLLVGLAAGMALGLALPAHAGPALTEMQRHRRRRWARRRATGEAPPYAYYYEPPYEPRPRFFPGRRGNGAQERMMIERHEVPSSYGSPGPLF